MNRLRDQVADYLRLRRALGYKLIEHERFLTQFLDYLDQTGASTITVENALSWAKFPVNASPNWHAARLSAVRGFAAWAHIFDPAIAVPPPGVLPLRTSRATPYLYSQQQIHALIDAAAELVPAQRAATFQTLIGLLVVTGMRVGEAIRADVCDLDLPSGALIVRGTKFGKSRRLPLHPSVVDAMSGYLRLRNQHPTVTTAALLVSTTGARLSYNPVHRTFKKLTTTTGIRARSPICRPQLHDLRHTFAVNTLLEAYRTGADPATRLPLLSTYLGHTEPANTYWYLHSAPELLAMAAARLDTRWASVTP
jgi:integrase